MTEQIATSEFALACERRWITEPGSTVTISIDAELQEVRDVLTKVNDEWMSPHEFEKSIGLECFNTAECDQCDLINRARALMEKLRISEVRP